MLEKVHKSFQRLAFWKLDLEILRIHLYKSSCLQFAVGWGGSFSDLFFSCPSPFSWAHSQHHADQTAGHLFLIKALNEEKHAGKKNQWSNLISSWEPLPLSSRRKRRKNLYFLFGALLVWTNLIGMSCHKGEQLFVASYEWHVVGYGYTKSESQNLHFHSFWS